LKIQFYSKRELKEIEDALKVQWKNATVPELALERRGFV